MPLLFGYGAASLATAGRLIDGLQVDRERMAANLALGGGTIMAEAAMIALAPIVGRARAHDIVYAACRAVGPARPTLESALRVALDDDVVERLPPLDQVLDPRRYLGEADQVVEVALNEWQDAVASD
ncbi:MAG: hypothetical protein H0T59_08875 [Chloroflexi bacterium]|nr:hypothetical protein [Chloroflexota bacterium]